MSRSTHLPSARCCAVIFVSLGICQTGEGAAIDLIDLSLEQLMNVEVTTATKTELRLVDAPATMRVITAKQIKERGYLTLDEALADLPGIQLRDIQGFNSYVFMRGVPNQNNLIVVMVDGVQINELNSGGFYGGLHYNLANVKQIEVVYGPASALYGTHAMSGIINIITRAPKDFANAEDLGEEASTSQPEARNHVSLLGGNLDTRLGDFAYGHYDEARRFGFSLSGMYKRSDKAEIAGAAGDNNFSTAADNWETALALDGKLQYRDLSFGFVYQDKDTSAASAETRLGTPFLDNGINWHIRFLNAHVNHVWDKPDDNWSLRSMFYYRNATVVDDTVYRIRNATAADGNPGFQERWSRPNDLWGVETQADWTFDSGLELTAGTVYEKERLALGFSTVQSAAVNLPAPEPPKPARTKNSLLSFYVQGRYPVRESMHLHLGVRRDDSSFYGVVTTPRAALVVNRDDWVLKFLYGEAFRAPRPWDFTDGLGNPNLQPEEMRSLEVAIGQSLSPHLRFDVSLYRNRLDNLLTRQNIGANFRQVNGAGVDTSGLEATLTCKRGRADSYLNYTFTDSSGAMGAPEPEIARHCLNGGVQYSLNHRLSLGLHAEWQGKRLNRQVIPTTGTNVMDDVLLLDATVSLTDFHGVNLQLAAKNLFDTVYYDTSNRTPSRYRQPQRTVLLKATKEF